LQSGLWSNAKLRKNWDASTANGAYRVRNWGPPIQLDHIRTRLFDHQDGPLSARYQYLLGEDPKGMSQLTSARFNTAANSFQTTSISSIVISKGEEWPHKFNPDRVSHRDDINSDAIHNLRDLVVPGTTPTFSSRTLHLLKFRNRDGHVG